MSDKVVNSVEFDDKEFKLSSFTGEGRWSCVKVARRDDVIERV